MASRWLRSGYGSYEGLVIPGRPTRSAATIVFGPENVTLRARQISAALGWSEWMHGWSVSYWTAAEGGGTGVGIHAEGVVAERLRNVQDEVATPWHRWIDGFRAPLAPGESQLVIPLYAAQLDRPSAERERETVAMMCRLLTDRPELRSRLTDVERMNQLITDMAENPKAAIGEPIHVRRSAIEARTAMHTLKLVHPYGGRPIPGDRYPHSQETAVSAVIASVEGNKFAAGVTLDPDEVASQLDKEFFSIEPWPFSALVDR